MGELSDAELRAANVTAAQTPAVLRQAAYELSRRERVHEDVTVELEIARQSWNASIQGSHLDGYILLLSDGSLPVMEFISCCHEAARLHSLLLSFNSTVRRVNSGHLMTPRFMVMDFSYTLIHSCVQAMNDGMQNAHSICYVTVACNVGS